VVLDSIIDAEFDLQPVNDFSGKIVVTDWHPLRHKDVGAALKQMLAEFGERAVYFPLDSPARADDWKHAVADLSSARLVVTGRHHGVCLAVWRGAICRAGIQHLESGGMLELLPAIFTSATIRPNFAICANRPWRTRDYTAKYATFSTPNVRYQRFKSSRLGIWRVAVRPQRCRRSYAGWTPRNFGLRERRTGRKPFPSNVVAEVSPPLTVIKIHPRSDKRPADLSQNDEPLRGAAQLREQPVEAGKDSTALCGGKPPALSCLMKRPV